MCNAPHTPSQLEAVFPAVTAPAPTRSRNAASVGAESPARPESEFSAQLEALVVHSLCRELDKVTQREIDRLQTQQFLTRLDTAVTKLTSESGFMTSDSDLEAVDAAAIFRKGCLSPRDVLDQVASGHVDLTSGHSSTASDSIFPSITPKTVAGASDAQVRFFVAGVSDGV